MLINPPDACRYCELTSWLTEIKCRSRDLPVDYNGGSLATTTAPNNRPPPVIVQQRGQKFAFETQIFDLRALTNYTFNVQVLQFVGEHPVMTTTTTTGTTGNERRSAGSARRLDWPDANLNQPRLQVEQTKAFGAEATRCLANASEVLVQTGRYFAGRISVEGQTDPRCSLLGNRSSEQTSYLFRIDHHVCHSKLTDSGRIETMILVHENRDILTHNTARFLVLCDFNHRSSFTVRASVSLPKVNGKLGMSSSPSAPSQPAIITRLKQPDASEQQQQQQVRIGSMPGVYRPLTTTAMPRQVEPTESSNQSTSVIGWTSTMTTTTATNKNNSNQAHNQQSWASVSSSPSLSPGQEVALNSIQASFPSNSSSRQAKKLESRVSPDAEASKKHETQQTTTTRLPAPVHVSGSLMFADDGHGISGLQRNGKSLLIKPANLSTQSDRQKVLIFGPSSSQHKRSQSSDDSDDDHQQASSLLSDQPVIMTNNHRVSGEFQPLNGQQAPLAAPESDKLLSIKYSPANVAEYSLGKLDEVAGRVREPSKQQPARSRSGRMRSMGSNGTDEPTETSSSKRLLESRMGDAMSSSSAAADLAVAESEQSPSNVLPGGQLEPTSSPINLTTRQEDSTLAQNLTSALVRWSLRTLGNLAKKSLESLAEVDNSSSLSAIEGAEQLPVYPTPATTTATKKSVGRQLARPTEPAVVQNEQFDGFVVDKTGGKGRAIVEETQTTARPRRVDVQPARIRHLAPSSAKEQLARSASHQTTTTTEANYETRAPEEHSRSSVWLIYGLWALVCLVCLTGAAIYLIIAQPRQLMGFNKPSSQHPQRPVCGQFVANQQLMFAPPGNQRHESLPSTSLSTSSSTLQKSLICPKQLGEFTQSQSSRSDHDDRTRSTSAASTCTFSGGEENYRKVNEFVFTDHVFINTFAGGGSVPRNESFA